MKKILSVLLTLLMVGSVALCEGVDLSAMSDEDLLALKSQVDSVVKDRGLDEKEIKAGVYAVGTFFEPGGYDFTVHGEDYVWVYIGVYNDENDVWDDDKVLTDFCLTSPEQSYHFDLVDGQYVLINIPGGTCTYKKS